MIPGGVAVDLAAVRKRWEHHVIRCGDIGDNPHEVTIEPLSEPWTAPAPSPAPVTAPEPEKVPA